MSQTIFIRPQTRKRTDGIKEKNRTVIFYALQIQCLQEGAILVMKTESQNISSRDFKP